jgi:hypothetical protein
MVKKIRRNDPCPCGSGKKYKNCCLKKSLDYRIKTPTITLKIMTDTAKLHLNTLASGVDSTKKIVVKSIDMMNGILVATFCPDSRDSIVIKIEVCQIVAYLSSLFDGEEKLGEFGITHFSARGLDDDDDEIMYAVSSKESARFARNGQSIEWLTHTLFQDNTDENRLSQAKVRISRVEKGLRSIISHVLKNRDGIGWWRNINIRVREGAENVYLNKYGVTTLPSGDELIEYTFLSSLKKVVLDNWNDFKYIFQNMNIFTNDMDRLNFIRREESHNRIISPSLIVELEGIYKRLLGSIGQEIPGTIPHFLIENWRSELAKIFDDLSKNMVELAPEDRKDLKVMMEKSQRYRNLISDLKHKLEGLTIPPNKKKLHSDLLDTVSRSVAALDRMIIASKIIDVKGIENAGKDHERCMEELNDFRKKYLLSEL